jgi:hypothetical protein
MTEAAKNFYKIRYDQGRCTIETINNLVTIGKLTQAEANYILNME